MPSISIRLSDDEYNHIHKQSIISGSAMSTYCRDVLLHHEVRDLLPRQEISKIMCVYHNKVDDAQTVDEVKLLTHEMEKKIWQHIK